jgi:hypothetical protein
LVVFNFIIFYDIVNNLFKIYMNLNPVEWSQAQDILLNLVQALKPLTERIVPTSFFLSRRFVIPSGLAQEDSPSILSRQSIRILSALHSVQKEVEKWIASPPKEACENAEPLEAPPLKEARVPPREAAPLSKQAQKLIQEVQKAIGELASSTYIQSPTEAPLRAALTKLKPNLDQIIDFMAHEKEPEETSAAFLRRAVPRLPGSPIAMKHSSFSVAHPKEDLPLPFPLPEVEKGAALSLSRAIPKGPEKEGRGADPAAPKEILGPPIGEEESALLAPKKKESVKEGRKPSKENPAELKPLKIQAVIEKTPSKENHTKTKVPLKFFEAIALPSAPFTSQTNNLIAPRKKKKRKGFWFKGEEDLEERNNS